MTARFSAMMAMCLWLTACTSSPTATSEVTDHAAQRRLAEAYIAAHGVDSDLRWSLSDESVDTDRYLLLSIFHPSGKLHAHFRWALRAFNGRGMGGNGFGSHAQLVESKGNRGFSHLSGSTTFDNRGLIFEIGYGLYMKDFTESFEALLPVIWMKDAQVVTDNGWRIVVTFDEGIDLLGVR